MTIENVLAEIDSDPRLTERQRLTAKARALREWRSIHGQTERVYGHREQTGLGRAFALSAVRSLARAIISALFRGLRGAVR